MARKKPYTARGIGRIPCARCGAPSQYQWNICALNNLYHGLCPQCDVELNVMVLRFMRIENWQDAALAYQQKVGVTLVRKPEDL